MRTRDFLFGLGVIIISFILLILLKLFENMLVLLFINGKKGNESNREET